MHVNPAEAVQTHRNIGARQSVAMHWSTVQLTDEGPDDPPLALAAARAAAVLAEDAFKVLAPAASFTV
jgi:N-acyl-phosphatidylethanolamine-hydrolysing phospholipase D